MTARTKIILVSFIYFVVLVVQLAAFTPYKKERTTYSSQNVPHTIIVERGYACIQDIGRYSTSGKNFYATQIDYSRALPQFLIPTGAAFAICFYIYKKDKDISQKASGNTAAQERIKSLETENQALKNLLLESDIAKAINQSSLQTPLLDYEYLDFADTNTRNKIIEQYEKSILQYARYKILREYIELLQNE